MSTEQNKIIAGRYFSEVLNQGNLKTVDELMGADFAFNITTSPKPILGPDGMKHFVTNLRNAFPDLLFTVDQHVAEDDRVLTRWHLTGTSKGAFMGIPPNGKTITDHGHDLFHIKDGQIKEMWISEDSMGLMKQLGVFPDDSGAKPPTDKNKAVMLRYFKEIMTDANLAIVDELISPNFYFTIPTHAPARGPEGFKKVVGMLHTAFPDLTFTVDDMFAEGDCVAVRWSARGTHQGVFLGIPASGKPFKIQGMGTYRIEWGQLVENLVNEDTLGLLMQIGAIPDSPHH